MRRTLARLNTEGCRKILKLWSLFLVISLAGIVVRMSFFSSPLQEAVTDFLFMFILSLPALILFFRINNRTYTDQQRLLLESAVKSVAEAVLIIDKRNQGYSNFRIVFTNNAFHRMSGFAPSETLNKNPVALLQGYRTDKKKLTRLLAAIEKNESFDEEIISYRKNGQPFWINLEVSPIWKTPDVAPRFFVAVVKDIDDQKVSEDERSKLTHEVIQRNKELQEFTQVVSHNLRAPVANILGLLSIMDYTQQVGDYNIKLLNLLKDSASNIDRILVDLNEVLQVKESVLESRQSFRLAELVREVLSSFHLQIEQAGASIEIEIEPAGMELHSVRSYFHSIVYNLASNGIKYRNPAKPLKLSIGAYQTSDSLVLHVKDNGLGMDLSMIRDKMFKLYKRFHTHVEGKGMGLFLTRNQIERLGGTISVHSKPGKGTLFRVTIPLENCAVIEREMQEAQAC